MFVQFVICFLINLYLIVFEKSVDSLKLTVRLEIVTGFGVCKLIACCFGSMKSYN